MINCTVIIGYSTRIELASSRSQQGMLTITPRIPYLSSVSISALIYGLHTDNKPTLFSQEEGIRTPEPHITQAQLSVSKTDVFNLSTTSCYFVGSGRFELRPRSPKPRVLPDYTTLPINLSKNVINCFSVI